MPVTDGGNGGNGGIVSLHLNPFHVLGATIRDGRNRIVELAEERSLVADEAACRDAQNTLTNLRGRLAAEMGWFPGVSPRKAAELAEGILTPALPATVTDLPPLARANVLYCFRLIDSGWIPNGRSWV